MGSKILQMSIYIIQQVYKYGNWTLMQELEYSLVHLENIVVVYTLDHHMLF